jgi:phenylacetate-CoA ligase
MNELPLRSIPGLTWPAIPDGAACQTWSLYRDLERTQWLSAAEIVAGQLVQARDLLIHCSRAVPYYRDLFRQARIEPAHIRTMDDFRRIPILQRHIYHAQFPSFRAESLPAGLTVTDRNNTSGTGGMAIPVWQTNLVSCWWTACCLRDLVWCGIDPRGTVASLRNLAMTGKSPQETRAGIESAAWSAHLAAVITTGRAFAMDIQQDPRVQLDWILRIQPDYLLGTPSNVAFLAGLLADRGERAPNLRAIQLIAETLTDADRTRIEAAFGVPVKNLYSCMEAGYLASECPQGHGLHVHAENVLLEVLDDNGNPCRAGETGRVVLTTLRNHVTPFVRYEILDRATLGPEQCPCGRGLPLLTRVEGKVRPNFHLPGGRRKTSQQLCHDLLKLGVYHQHQIIQRAINHFIIRVAPNRHWNETSTGRIVQCTQDFLEVPVRVEVEVVDRLELTAGGKLRDVIVEVSESH